MLTLTGNSNSTGALQAKTNSWGCSTDDDDDDRDLVRNMEVLCAMDTVICYDGMVVSCDVCGDSYRFRTYSQNEDLLTKERHLKLS